jgi:nucleotide-binding universal stress UspA family protein
MKRIIVGLDGTEKDHDVVSWAADFVRDTGAQVVAAHFVPRPSLWIIAGAQIDSGKYLEELRRHFEDHVLGPMKARLGDVRLYVDIGDPAHELALLAQHTDADLIAVGARAHGAVHDVVFGNLERRIVHEARVPVVTVPCRTRQMRLVR